MISYVKGYLAAVGEDYAIVDVQGIGYRLGVSAMTIGQLPSTGKEVQLYSYMQVREDAIALFGFYDPDEKEMFERLIGVNGIGPKAALAILSIHSVNDLKFAILAEDAKAISKAPGVGAKTAQRVIMELKDKISLTEAFEERSTAVSEQGITTDASRDAIEGLTALGYSASEAMKAVKSIENGQNMNAEQLLKAALKHLF